MVEINQIVDQATATFKRSFSRVFEILHYEIPSVMKHSRCYFRSREMLAKQRSLVHSRIVCPTGE